MMSSSFHTTTSVAHHQQQQNVLNHAQQQQHRIANFTTANATLLQSPPAVAAIGYLQQPQINQQQFAAGTTAAATVAATPMQHTPAATYFDARQLQNSGVVNNIDKNFYTNGGTTAAAHYFTTAHNAANPAVAHPSTILITNNFAQQQSRTSAGYNNNSIRIVSTAPPVAAATTTSLPTTQPSIHNSQQKHVCHLNNLVNKDAQQPSLPQLTDILQVQTALLPTTNSSATQQQQHHLYQQSHQQQLYAQQQPHIPATFLTQQHFGGVATVTQPQSHNGSMQLQHFYIPTATETSVVTNNTNVAAKLLPTSIVTSAHQHPQQPQHPNVTSALTAATATTNSTVVLDRINICINNHYTDAVTNTTSNTAAGSCVSSSSSTSNSLTSNTEVPTPQQPSPIIPAIQHKTFVEVNNGGLLADPYSSNESTTLVIDEPDSTTTTPHTPPTTPENCSPPSSNSNSSEKVLITISRSPNDKQSRCTTSTITKPTILPIEFKPTYTKIVESIDKEAYNMRTNKVNGKENSWYEKEKGKKEEPEEEVQQHERHNKPTVLEVIQIPAIQQPLASTPLTPPSPTTPSMNTTTSTFTGQSTQTQIMSSPVKAIDIAYVIGEDVFIKRQDERFYLGTVIEMGSYGDATKFLVRFDDKSEIWCTSDEMRKLGGGTQTGSGSEPIQGPMCVACKRTQSADIVEICERCGRGYHRNCTTETSPGSGVLLCKRCVKPMKLLSGTIESSIKTTVWRQLPYHVDTLSWDEKHRVNEEQIYCYCGKSGKFDHNMLQCCKCRNWFHTSCLQCFERKILRGDCFFVFCCSVCNNGAEFLRRLQPNWVDLLHLTLYNLTVIKKHHKYHHLSKDIWPFVLQKRKILPIPKARSDMTDDKLMELLKNTLKENTDRFICGREMKKGHFYYALRSNAPPQLPKLHIKPSDVLCNEFLTKSLKLTLLKGAPENKSVTPTMYATVENNIIKNKFPQEDIYEFRIEDDDTSEDEIPIKHIIEKARKKTEIAALSSQKKNKMSKCFEKIDLEDENANDAKSTCHLSVTSKKNSPLKAEAKEISKGRRDTLVSGSISSTKSKETKEYDNCSKFTTDTTAVVEVTARANNTDIGCSTVEKEKGKSSRKRKAFTLSNTYKEVAAEAAAKRYDSSRICDSSSDENSSSSRGTSLDLIIPPPKNFLGINNPFRMVTPKKHNNVQQESGGGSKKTVSFCRSGGPFVKKSIFNTTTLDFSSKLAALKCAGIFPNLSTSDLAKAAGQPRTVRTIKRRLSAKDITIGPNQEVRRRRTRRLSSHVEVISTTTINPIPSNFFPIHAKDFLSSSNLITNTLISSRKLHFQHQTLTLPAPTSSSSSPSESTTSSLDAMPIAQQVAVVAKPPTHGRRLRQRPQKLSPGNSRRSSLSGASTSSNSSVVTTETTAAVGSENNIMQDLKQSVNKYFGAANRIESGEQFSIRAKRQLTNGQMQYLIEWGDTNALSNASSNSTSAA